MANTSFEQGRTVSSEDAVSDDTAGEDTAGDDAALADIIRSVIRQLDGRVDSQAVEAEVGRAAAVYRGARIRQFVPIFIERDVLKALTAQGDTSGGVLPSGAAEPPAVKP